MVCYNFETAEDDEDGEEDMDEDVEDMDAQRNYLDSSSSSEEEEQLEAFLEEVPEDREVLLFHLPLIVGAPGKSYRHKLGDVARVRYGVR